MLREAFSRLGVGMKLKHVYKRLTEKVQRQVVSVTHFASFERGQTNRELFSVKAS